MPTTPPNSPFDTLLDRLAPPPWMVDEAQQRIVLLLNHVLMQEHEAMARLGRQAGRKILVQWKAFSLVFLVTRAGLLDRAGLDVTPDLTLTVAPHSPLELLRRALAAEKPEVRIEGDVQLAAEVNWLADHVRWDLEEDLARIVGDAPAHALGEAARRAVAAIRGFVASRQGGSGPMPVAPRT